MKMGATGEFPEGKLNKDDEGQLLFGVAADVRKGVVIVNFNTPVNWFALPPDLADQLATLLQNKANEVRGNIVSKSVM